MFTYFINKRESVCSLLCFWMALGVTSIVCGTAHCFPSLECESQQKVWIKNSAEKCNDGTEVTHC